MTADEIALLEAVAVNRRGPKAGQVVDLTVTGCAYACCGKGWRRRDGYEQTYHGYIDQLQLPEGDADGTLMLYSRGIGTISYVIACRFSEIVEARRPSDEAPEG